MAPFGYPVMLELSGRRVVVIGTLPVAEGKVEGLLAGGATDVVVVANAPPRGSTNSRARRRPCASPSVGAG